MALQHCLARRSSERLRRLICRVRVGVAFALRIQLRKPHKHPAPQVENIAQET